MYRFLYETIVPLYGIENLRLGKMDTDSFMLDISVPNAEHKLLRIRNELDTSNYPTDHPLYSKEGAKQVGLFKNESPVPISERAIVTQKVDAFTVALASKLATDWTVKTPAWKCVCKGGDKNYLKRHSSFQDFKNVVLGGSTLKTESTRLVSKNHIITTTTAQKTAARPYSDKMHYAPCGVACVPHGHYRTV